MLMMMVNAGGSLHPADLISSCFGFGFFVFVRYSCKISFSQRNSCFWAAVSAMKLPSINHSQKSAAPFQVNGCQVD